MYPSSWRRRAISSFMREVGMATVSCIARFALRMRLSMSAIGSVSISSSLPAGLGHSRNGSLVREVAEADPAELVAAEHGTRPAAAVAARVGANAVLRLALLLHAERGLGHMFLRVPSLGGERHPERAQERPALLVGLRRRRDRDVEAPDRRH